jgi:hypothetical protein
MPGAHPPCGQFAAAVQTGTLFDGPSEVSGIVASREQPDVFWIHEDAGAQSILYAISGAGALLGQWKVKTPARIYDWEDIAIEPVAGGPDRIWVGDVGDNGVRDGTDARGFVSVDRFSEPVVDRTQPPVSGTVTALDSFQFTYPDRPHDAEAIAVEPITGDLYIFGKDNPAPSGIFRARAPLTSGVLELVGTVDATYFDGADFAPAGDELLVRSYGQTYYWSRAPGATWDATFGTSPKRIHLPNAAEGTGEAIGFAPDASGFYTISENINAPLLYYEKTCP